MVEGEGDVTAHAMQVPYHLSYAFNHLFPFYYEINSQYIVQIGFKITQTQYSFLLEMILLPPPEMLGFLACATRPSIWEIFK